MLSNNDFSSDSTDSEFHDLLAKAEQGDATAQYWLGWCYEYGQGVAKDEKKAVEWYTKAAERGFAAAQDRLKELKSTT